MATKKNLETSFSLPESEVCDEAVFHNRRRLIKALGIIPAAYSFSPVIKAACEGFSPDKDVGQVNSWHQISHYNNYFEFSTNKQAVALLAKDMPTRPWTLEVSGEVDQARTFTIEQLLTSMNIVERIYRFRCVEGWSMVIPWSGFQLCDLLSKVKPSSRARYVQFISHVDDKYMIGLNRTGLQFPYREALRMDEAMHPLTLMATGIYGRELPNQNGAPLRLVVPWKYGFKSSKSIVKIILSEQMPQTSWNQISPSEYGFYANVNPRVAHPRWSQRKENKIGELKKKKTLMFNGYEAQVAHLYRNMNLVTNY